MPVVVRSSGGDIVQNLKRAFLDGAMVVVPIGAIALLIVAIIQKLQAAANPLAGQYVHPAIAAVVLLVLLFLLVGFVVRSAQGRRARGLLEAILFEKIPGYRLVKAFTKEGPLVTDDARTLRPALAAIEEGLCPALVMDEFADGRLVVFVPGAPAPMSGAIYIFTPDKITLLDVPLLPFLKSISSWGLGLKGLIETAALPAEASR